jgi:hypothetical protein
MRISQALTRWLVHLMLANRTVAVQAAPAHNVCAPIKICSSTWSRQFVTRIQLASA